MALYTSGRYAAAHPTWHVEDSPWKAGKIVRMLQAHGVTPRSVCEVGCGAGEILAQLQQVLDPSCAFVGYDIAPVAIDMARPRENDRLRFVVGDFLETTGSHDLILAIDLIEHVEDYFPLLRAFARRGRHTILHVPLDVYVWDVIDGAYFRIERERYGHIHYFTPESAFEALAHAGLRVVDHVYTAGWQKTRPSFEGIGIRGRLWRRLRDALFARYPAHVARIMGGCSVLVLAEASSSA